MPENLKIAPEDPRSFVYIIFYWLGIGTLLPWNFFISVSEYWKGKWATPQSLNDSDIMDLDSNATGIVLNDLQTNWGGHLAMASMVPNVTVLLLNAAFGHRFRTQPRLLVSLCVVIALFIVTCVFAKLDTDSWQIEFYHITLATVVLININAAIFQGGLLGIAGKFPPRYIGGVFSGQALGGIFASATNIAFLAMGANVTDAAFYSFLIAVIFLFTALLCYISVTRSQFFKFFVNEDGDTVVPQESLDLIAKKEDKEVEVEIPTKVNPFKVLTSISLYVVSIFLIFTVTLGCFPAITVLIVSTGYEDGGEWSTKYFIPVACFLLFNVGDYLGRIVAEFVKWPKPGRIGMILVFLLSVSRLVFIPLFVLCNVSPNNRNLTSVIFESDYVYIIFMLIFSVSNGYLGGICMMSAPQICKSEEQQTAASLMVAFLGLGLGAGSALSNVFVKLI